MYDICRPSNQRRRNQLATQKPFPVLRINSPSSGSSVEHRRNALFRIQGKLTYVISYDKKLRYLKEEVQNNIKINRVKKGSVHTEFSLHEFVEVKITNVQ